MTPRTLTRRTALQSAAAFGVALATGRLVAAEAEHPLDAKTRDQIRETNDAVIASATKSLATNPNDGSALSKRGDAYFFQSRFKEAVADYDAMLKLDPALDASHWRRGIALFYVGRYEDAASQFERYHSFDNVDRENGIWRFLCQTKSLGLEKARAALLKYEKDDREPFPDVFRLFAGTIKADDILTHIREAKLPDDARNSRLFYADLYIGLNHVVQSQPMLALESLHRATRNSWPRTAGYGPNWMWHVGRVQWEQLAVAK